MMTNASKRNQIQNSRKNLILDAPYVENSALKNPHGYDSMF